MLLKAAIRHRQGKIRKPCEKQTIGFGACVRKGLTAAGVKFLSDEQALTLQSINGQRDAAQDYLLDMFEYQLYFHAQAGVTLFRDIHDDGFDDELVVELPERVLPVSTTAHATLRPCSTRSWRRSKDHGCRAPAGRWTRLRRREA